MTRSYICSYVHYRKRQRSLQGHTGSCMGRHGTFGEVVWKGSVGVHECGGTLRKNACGRHPHGAGVRGSAYGLHVAPRPVRLGGLRPQRLAPGTPQRARTRGRARRATGRPCCRSGARHGAPRRLARPTAAPGVPACLRRRPPAPPPCPSGASASGRMAPVRWR
jgi:hypothetical protein